MRRKPSRWKQAVCEGKPLCIKPYICQHRGRSTNRNREISSWRSEYNEHLWRSNRQELSQCPGSAPVDPLSCTCHLLSSGWACVCVCERCAVARSVMSNMWACACVCVSSRSVIGSTLQSRLMTVREGGCVFVESDSMMMVMMLMMMITTTVVLRIIDWIISSPSSECLHSQNKSRPVWSPVFLFVDKNCFCFNSDGIVLPQICHISTLKWKLWWETVLLWCPATCSVSTRSITLHSVFTGPFFFFLYPLYWPWFVPLFIFSTTSTFLPTGLPRAPPLPPFAIISHHIKIPILMHTVESPSTADLIKFC